MYTGKKAVKTIPPNKCNAHAQSLNNRFYLKTRRYSMHPKTTGNRKTSLSWPANPLRHSPRPDAQVHHTAGSAAPPSTPPRTGRSPDHERRTERRRERERSRPDKRGEHFRTRGERSSREKASSQLQHDARPPHTTLTLHTKVVCCPPFVERGSALRSSPFSAPPPFELLGEASRRGGVPSRSPPTPPRAGAGAVSFGSGPGHYSPKKRPPPFLTFDPRLGSHFPPTERGEIRRESEPGENRREKQAGKVRAGSARAFVLAILRAFLDGFHHGNRRRVVRGGRRS